MTAQADILTFNRDKELVLLVQVRNKLGTDANWAAQMRRNLMAHGLSNPADFFLLALPDQFYLWTDNPRYDTPPTFVVDPIFLSEYFGRVGVTLDTITNTGFEMIVWNWLSDVADHPEAWQHLDWLSASGLLKAIQDGSVEFGS